MARAEEKGTRAKLDELERLRAEASHAGDQEAIELHALDPEAERRQIERTQLVRAERGPGTAEAALTRLRGAARGDENLLPAMREALAAMCTVGEICNALREEFGTYDAHLAP